MPLVSTLLDRFLEEPAAQARTLDDVAHRPWPLPRRPWRMGQTWRHLLFAHWPIDAHLLRPYVPPGLSIDEFDGSAWIGITPFMIEALRMRGTLPLPFASTFPELNIRTYASLDGRGGVVFLRLDTPSMLAIAAARLGYRLPYEHASIAFDVDDESGAARVRAERDDGSFSLEYAPDGPAFHAEPGSLEQFLAERYRLYTTNADGQLAWAEIHHAPWRLQPAAASVHHVGYLPDRIVLDGEPIVHLAQRQDVVIWALRTAASS